VQAYLSAESHVELVGQQQPSTGLLSPHVLALKRCRARQEVQMLRLNQGAARHVDVGDA